MAEQRVLRVRKPPGMSVQAEAVWDEVKEVLEGNDLLYNVPQLLIYCETYALWKGAVKAAKDFEDGLLPSDDHKNTTSHWEKAERLASRLLDISRRFAFTPPDSTETLWNDSRLNNKQKLYVQGYLEMLDKTKAAEFAGYSKKSAYRQGNDLFKHPVIQEHIQAGMRAFAAATPVTKEEIVAGLRREAQGDGPDSSSAARNQALNLLGKIGGVFEEDNAQKGSSTAALDKLSESQLTALGEKLDKEATRRASSSVRNRTPNKKDEGNQGDTPVH